MNIAVRIGGGALVVLGILAILAALVSPDSFEGLSLDTGALLLAGGLVALGLSELTAAVDGLRDFVAGEDQDFGAFDTNSGMSAASHHAMQPSAKADTARAEPQVSAAPPEPEIVSPMVDMPKASGDRRSRMKEKLRIPLEQAVEDVTEFHPPPVSSDEVVSEEELYVVEERTIAGKPARILSDGTVEAETDDGWMRFENVEHLEEYIDAMRSQRG